MDEKQEKVAILGGGISSLTAALELSEQKLSSGKPKYAITIYQMGWRLGGKMATGRNLEKAKGHRIEEHGIHGFMGSYYNAGTLMTRVFSELRNIPGLKGFFTSFDDAFEGQNSAVRWEYINNSWLPWLVELEPNKLTYDQFINSNPNTMFLRGFRSLIEEALEQLESSGLLKPEVIPTPNLTSQPGRTFTPENLFELKEIVAQLMSLIVAAIQNPKNLQKLKDEGPRLAEKLKSGFEVFRKSEWTWQFLSTPFRRALIQVDYVITLLTGFFDDDILTRGYAYLDKQDYSCWLTKHGATRTTVCSPMSLNSAAITYNFTDGDMTQGPRMSAGAYLQWSLSVSAYVGSFIWAFKAGSGESVIAPIYRLLVQRKVKFKFFHKVTGLNLTRDKKNISSVSLDVQAYVKRGLDYQPLVGPVAGLMCWPSEPRYEQLRKAKTLKKRNLESTWDNYREERTWLKKGRDYDRLVLGISLGAFKHICPNLIRARKSWKSMVDKIETVPTQAMQLWFKEPVKNFTPQEIQFKYKKDLWVAGTYLMPISGQADFTSTLDYEGWPQDGPQGVLYMCGPMSDQDPGDFKDKQFPEKQKARVKAQCIQYLESCAAPFLTGASTAGQDRPTILGSLDFEQLYCKPDSDCGEKRFEFQFWRANIEPSERYVTCQPGAGQFRLKAGKSGFDNLTLCGDWIHTGLNVGSVEGAMMGGRLAANAICKSPAIKDIYGYRPFP